MRRHCGRHPTEFESRDETIDASPFLTTMVFCGVFWPDPLRESSLVTSGEIEEILNLNQRRQKTHRRSFSRAGCSGYSVAM